MSFNKAFDVKGHDDDHVLKQTFSDIDRPKDWKPSGKDEKGRDQYIVLRRILTPVSVQSRIYVPWLQKNDGDPKGTMIYLGKDKNNSFVVPEVLKMATKADLEVKANLRWDMAKTRSIFSPVDVCMYLVLCRDADDDKKTTIFVAEYPKSVAQGIISVGHKEHPKFKLKYKGEEVPALMHGPVLLYDLMLTKFVDTKQDPMFGTRYEVEPDINNNWSGKVPANIYKYGYPENWKWDDVFTKEEQEAINAFMETNKSDSLLGSLEKKAASLITSEENVFKAISQFNANATDPKGAPLLPDVSQFLKTFGEISGKNLIGNSVAVAGEIGETTASATKEETFEEAEEVTEGDFEEVETKSDESFFEDAPEEKAEDSSANPFGEAADTKEDDPFA